MRYPGPSFPTPSSSTSRWAERAWLSPQPLASAFATLRSPYRKWDSAGRLRHLNMCDLMSNIDRRQRRNLRCPQVPVFRPPKQAWLSAFGGASPATPSGSPPALLLSTDLVLALDTSHIVYPNCLDNHISKINTPRKQPLHQLQERLQSHPGNLPPLVLQRKQAPHV